MLKLFDKAFFRQAFIFFSIILVGFMILLVVGYYDLKDKQNPGIEENNLAKTVKPEVSTTNFDGNTRQ